MRILQLISQTAIGGAETFALNLSCELVRRGHEVLLLSNRANGPLFELPRPPGLEVSALDRTSRRDPRIIRFLTSSIVRFRPEVIHSHNFEANTWARSMGLLFPRIRIVCHEHSGLKGRQKRNRDWLDRLLYRRCAAVFCVNEELRELMRDRIGIEERILHVLPNGIEVERYEPPASVERNRHEAVCVASLTPVKNHAMLIDAWSEVIERIPEARLTLVGDGALRGDLHGKAHARGIGQSITFAGLTADVRPFLWKASVFVMSSHREGLPLSLLEAMSAGLACVAPSVGGIPQALAHGDAGVLVPAGDASALAEALAALLSDPGACRRLGERAHRQAAERYSLRACADRIEAAYSARAKPGNGGN